MFQDKLGCFLKSSHCFLLPFSLRQVIDLSSYRSSAWSLIRNLLLIQQEKTNGVETAACPDLFYMFVFVFVHTDSPLIMSTIHIPYHFTY